jgi:hypothetical protein
MGARALSEGNRKSETLRQSVTKSARKEHFHAHDFFIHTDDVARRSPSALIVPNGGGGRPRRKRDRADGAKSYAVNSATTQSGSPTAVAVC